MSVLLPAVSRTSLLSLPLGIPPQRLQDDVVSIGTFHMVGPISTIFFSKFVHPPVVVSLVAKALGLTFWVVAYRTFGYTIGG